MLLFAAAISRDGRCLAGTTPLAGGLLQSLTVSVLLACLRVSRLANRPIGWGWRIRLDRLVGLDLIHDLAAVLILLPHCFLHARVDHQALVLSRHDHGRRPSRP